MAAVLVTEREAARAPRAGAPARPLDDAAERLVAPQKLLLFLLALAPFDGLLTIIPHPGLVEGWKEALLLLAVGAAILHPPARGRVLQTWGLSVCVLVALGVLSFLLRPDVTGLKGLKVNAFYLLAPYVLWRHPLSRRGRDVLVSVLMGCGTVCALVGLGQQVLGPERLVELGYTYNTQVRFAGGVLRSFSTFDLPFSFAFYEMLVLLIGVPVALADRTRLRNRLFLLATPLLALGAASAVVRGAAVGLVAGILVLAWFGHRRLLWIPVLAGVVLLAAPGAVSGAAFSTSSGEQRLSAWQNWAPTALEHPFGTGVGSAGSVAQEALAADLGLGAPDLQLNFGLGTASQLLQPDNTFIKTAMELGLPGALLLATALGAAFLAARRWALATDDPVDRGLARGIGAVVVAAAAASLVATFLELFPVDLVFWTLVGVIPAWPLASSATPSR